MLDVFGGSGSTLIGADRCGRVAGLIEIEPLYCDTIIRRFQRITGEQAVLADGGASFAAVMRHGRLKRRLGRIRIRDWSHSRTMALPPLTTASVMQLRERHDGGQA